MRRVGVISFTLASLLIVGVWAKSDNANSKSEDKCNNGLGNDKEKCYDGDKAGSINGNAYGLFTNKFAVSSDDSLADEETQQANEETLTEFEEVHQTIAENFLLVKEIPSEIEIISEEPQYVNGEVVARVYNLGTKASARAVGEVSGYMVMSLNEGDVPIKAFSLDTKYEDLYEPFKEFINLQLYEMKKLSEIDTNLRVATPPPAHAKAWGYLKKFKSGEPLPQIDLVLLDINRGKVHKSNKKSKFRKLNNDVPLTTTTWGQLYPFNLKMPELPDIGEGISLSMTGCSVTGWAQIMKYHQWPPRGVGESSTYFSEYDDSMRIEIASRDLNNNYSWDDMYLHYSSSGDYKSSEYEDVATLMSDIAHALQCSYKLGGTSCSSDRLEDIERHFGYSTEMSWFYHDINNLSSDESALSKHEELKRVIANDINNSLPLLLSYHGIEIFRETLEGDIVVVGENIDIDREKDIITFGNDTELSMKGSFVGSSGITENIAYIDEGNITVTSGEIVVEDEKITITNGVSIIQTPEDFAHLAIIDGYEYINEVGFSVRINVGFYGNTNNFYVFSDETQLLEAHKYLAKLTATNIGYNILPCSGTQENNDCSEEYIDNGGEIKPSNFKVERGWQLKALRSDKSIDSIYFDQASQVWSYDKNESGEKEWFLNPVEIRAKQGFWVNHQEKTSYLTPGSEDDSTFLDASEISENGYNDKSWHLLGTGVEISEEELNSKFDAKEIWVNRNSEWIENPNGLEAGEGFWYKSN